MQATSEGKALGGTMQELAMAEARTASAIADDREFSAEERRLWNATPEMLDALVEASKKIGNAVKSGHNDHDRYDYGTLEDFLNACRAPLLEHGLLLVSRPVCDPLFSEAKTKAGTTMQVARVLVETRVIHAASKGWIAARVWGEGRDLGDKAIYKALTGGRKYALAMVLGIYTTDEPEGDSPPAAASREGSRPGARPPRDAAKAPSPPADSARQLLPPPEWTDELQERFVAKLGTLTGDDERTFAAKAREAADYIGRKKPGMSDAQVSAACTALIARCDQVRTQSPHLMTEEEARAVFNRVTQIMGLAPASQMPGAPTEPETEREPGEEG